MALTSLGVLLTAALLAPAGAHVTDDVNHLWNDHIKGKATGLFYKKAESDARFLPGSSLPNKRAMAGTWGQGGNSSASSAATDMQSFPQRLKNRPAFNVVRPGDANANCPGNHKNPTAKPGHLCLYVNVEFGEIGSYCPFDPSSDTVECGAQTHANRVGFGVTIIAEGGTQFGAFGTWAVTAGPTPVVEPPEKAAARGGTALAG